MELLSWDIRKGSTAQRFHSSDSNRDSGVTGDYTFAAFIPGDARCWLVRRGTSDSLIAARSRANSRYREEERREKVGQEKKRVSTATRDDDGYVGCRRAMVGLDGGHSGRRELWWRTSPADGGVERWRGHLRPYGISSSCTCDQSREHERRLRRGGFVEPEEPAGTTMASPSTTTPRSDRNVGTSGRQHPRSRCEREETRLTNWSPFNKFCEQLFHRETKKDRRCATKRRRA